MRNFIKLFLVIILLLEISFSNSPPPKILLVEDSHVIISNDIIRPIYQMAIENAGFVFSKGCVNLNVSCYNNYTVLNSSDDGPSFSILSQYDIVIWFTGRDFGDGSPTLTPKDIDNVKNYLNNGGNIFITGEGVAADMNRIGRSDFLKNFFNLTYFVSISEASNVANVYGITNDDVGDGIFGESVINGLYRQTPDVVLREKTRYPCVMSGGGPSILGLVYCIESEKSIYYNANYNKSSTNEWAITPPGILTYNSTSFKSVFSSFALEGMGNNVTRNLIIKRIIWYLTLPQTKNSKVEPNVTKSLINITSFCEEDQLFGRITDAEFFIDNVGNYGSGIKLNASDGNFNNKTEAINGTLDTSNLQEGLHTLLIHCKNSDNKWGKFDLVNFTVDRTPPESPLIRIEDGKNYTNNTKPKITISIPFGNPSNPNTIPDFFALSCDNINYTEWIRWPDKSSTLINYYNFDITNSSVGCSITDGSRNVYVKVRDLAGNVNPTTSASTITLDREAPKILSIVPSNNSFVNSSKNITVSFFDSLSNVELSLFNNGSVTASFKNNTPFNPGWVSEGIKTLRIILKDFAGNYNISDFVYTVDNSPPSTINNASSQWKANDQLISLNCFDSISGCNSTFFKNDSVWLEGNLAWIFCQENNVCIKTLYYYSKDNAENFEEVKNVTVKIDKKAPSVEIIYPTTGFYNRILLINVSANDEGIGLDKVFFFIKNSTYQTGLIQMNQISSNLFFSTFNTSLLADGIYNLTIFANDSLNNINNSVFVKINIDNSPPFTNDNSTAQWLKEDTTINLTCNDFSGSGCKNTYYCIGESCTPNIIGNLISISCNLDSVCITKFRYRSEDKLGNLEGIKENITKIDKEKPFIRIDNPSNGTTHSGIINILTTIEDFGAGIDKAWYEIRNASNLTQILDSGFLLPENNFDTTWNSSSISKGTLILNVSANDTLGNLRFNINVTFFVDNSLPTILIFYPSNIYLNKSFNLDIRASTPSEASNISNASWKIFNKTGDLISQNLTLDINKKQFNFTDFINISGWLDGNYTIIANVNDTSNNFDKSEKWFVIDRVPPITTDNSSSLTNWVNESVLIYLNCQDPLLQDNTNGSGCSKTLYCINSTSIDCSPNIEGNLVLVECSINNICRNFVKYFSIDKVGNVGNLNSTSEIKIDKKAPITNSNVSSGWFKNDVGINLTCSDEGIGCDKTFYCLDSVDLCNPNSIFNPSLGIRISCSENSVCNNFTRFRSIDLLDNLEQTKSVNIKIDKEKPKIEILEPGENSLLNKIIKIKSRAFDLGIGIDKVFFYFENSSFNSSLNEMSFISSNVYESTFNTSLLADGIYNLTIFANDSLNNINSTKIRIKIDNTPPNSSNYFVNSTRVFINEAFSFSLDAFDENNVSKVIAEINGQNYSLSLVNGNYSFGKWEVILSFENVGLVKVNKLYLFDTLNNSKIVDENEINISIFVVDAMLNVSEREINVGDIKNITLTFNFNKTVNKANLTLYFPKNIFNVSEIRCEFNNNCQINLTNNIAEIKVNGSDSLVKLNFNISTKFPNNDSNETWIIEFRNKNYTNLTLLKVPNVVVENILCNGSEDCNLNQFSLVNFSIIVSNVNTSFRSGIAKNVSLELLIEEINFANNSVLGNILPNETKILNLTLNVSKAGNLTFLAKAHDKTLNYNSSLIKFLNVSDKESPKIESVFVSRNFVNINESLLIIANVTDNINVSFVEVEIVNPDSFAKNYSLTFNGSLWILNFTNNSLLGNYSIDLIFANDTSNNFNQKTLNITFFVSKLEINSSLSSYFVNFNSSIKIFVNISGNASEIKSVEATIIKPRNFNDTITLNYNSTINNTHIFEGIYNNTTQSGNYSVIIKVEMEKIVENVLNFSVSFGNIFVKSKSLINGLQSKNSTVNLFVVPLNGDLENINVFLSIENESVVNSSLKSKFLGNITFEENKNGILVEWPLEFKNVGETNLTFTFNSSTGKNNEVIKNITINVVSEDLDNPKIDFISKNFDKINLMEELIVEINVTDNTLIDNVTVEITYPNFAKENLTAIPTDLNKYSLVFNNSNSTGNYSFRVIAFDIAGNFNVSNNFEFEVFNNYSVILTTDKGAYVKGNVIKIFVDAKNVNNISVNNFNLTILIDKDEGINTTIENKSLKKESFYEIKPSDKPTTSSLSNYKIYAIVEKNGNKGEAKKQITIGKIFTVIINYPLSGQTFKVGEPVPIDVKVLDINGSEVKNARVVVDCPVCGNRFAILEFVENKSYFSSAAFLAPETPNNQFEFFVYAADAFGNDQGTPPPGRILSSSSGGTLPGTQPSAGGAPGAAPLKECICSEWKTIGCVGNDLYQIRSCNPVGCANETQIFRNHSLCKETIIDFEILYDKEIEVEKGLDSKIILSIENKGNTPINLTITHSLDCKNCSIFYEKILPLYMGEKKSLQISFRAPLYMDPGSYTLILRFEHNITKEAGIKVNIKESSEIIKLNELIKKLERLENTVKEYESFNINVSVEKNILEDSKILVENAKIFIGADNLQELKNINEKLNKNINDLESLIQKKLLIFLVLKYKKEIIVSIVILFLTSYFTYGLIDVYSIRRETLKLKRKLKELEESRRETQVQYFKRKLTEKAFYDIMIKTQSEIFNVESAIKENEKLMRKIIRDTLTFRLMGEFLKKPFKKLKIKKNIAPGGI